MKILQVADRPGWAIDKLSKPLSEIYDNVDMSYFSADAKRYIDSGYSDWKSSIQYTHELGNKYDIVHAHHVDAFFNKIGKLDKRVRKVLTIHTDRPADFNDIRITAFDNVICSTRHAYNELLKNLSGWENGNTVRVHFVPQGIDLTEFKVGGKNNIQPEPRNIGFVGRIVEWKRYDVIQKAAHDAGLKLVGCGFVGQGNLRNVHNLQEDKDYKFYNYFPEPLMPDFYARMNLFICLSKPHIESGPLPVKEAMACGIPVISTRIGWAVDHCEHLKNIYFIEEDEIDQLHIVIRMLYNDKVLREIISRNALELIKNFSMKIYAKNLMKIYETEKT